VLFRRRDKGNRVTECPASGTVYVPVHTVEVGARERRVSARPREPRERESVGCWVCVMSLFFKRPKSLLSQCFYSEYSGSMPRASITFPRADLKRPHITDSRSSGGYRGHPIRPRSRSRAASSMIRFNQVKEQASSNGGSWTRIVLLSAS